MIFITFPPFISSLREEVKKNLNYIKFVIIGQIVLALSCKSYGHAIFPWSVQIQIRGHQMRQKFGDLSRKEVGVVTALLSEYRPLSLKSPG